MATHQSKAQKETVSRVMYEFKHGELETGSGKKVKNPKQAIAIGLREAGASKYESKAKNRENLKRTKARTTRRDWKRPQRATRRPDEDPVGTLCGGQAPQHSRAFENEQGRTRSRFALVTNS